MINQIFTIQEAAKFSQKSTQTIRRLIKTNKIKCKRKRTPQGFNYEIQRDSVIKYFDLPVEETLKSNGKNSKENEVFELSVEPDIVRSKRQKKSVAENIAIPVEAMPLGASTDNKEDILEGISIEETTETDQRTSKDTVKFANVLQQIVKQQKRTLILEDRIRRLEAPKRVWWRLW